MALTQARGFGAHSGQPYGSFADKAGSTHPVGRLTQLRAYGAHSGQVYGLFDGKPPGVTPPPTPPVQNFGGYRPRRVFVPDEARKKRLTDDETILLLFAEFYLTIKDPGRFH